MSPHTHSILFLYSSLVSRLVACAYAIVKLVRIQLYIFLVALPLLAAWGLPVSYGSFLGNIIFGPFIVLFLSLSICWTGLYFLGVPGGLLSKLLDAVAQFWIWCLSGGTAEWLCGVPSLSLPLNGLLFVAILSIVYGRTRGIYGIGIEMLLLVFLGCMVIGCARGYVRYIKAVSVLQGGKELTVCWYKGEVYVLDRAGVLRNNRSLEAWGKFTVRPLLVQQFGVCKAGTIVLYVPTQQRLQAALRLVALGICDSIGVPEHCMRSGWFQRWHATAYVQHTTAAAVPGSKPFVRVVPLEAAQLEALLNVVWSPFDKGEKGCNTKLCSNSSIAHSPSENSGQGVC